MGIPGIASASDITKKDEVQLCQAVADSLEVISDRVKLDSTKSTMRRLLSVSLTFQVTADDAYAASRLQMRAKTANWQVRIRAVVLCFSTAVALCVSTAYILTRLKGTPCDRLECKGKA